MFIIERHDKDTILNLASSASINLNKSDIELWYPCEEEAYTSSTLEFKSNEDAQKAYNLIIEALRRGDKLLYL